MAMQALIEQFQHRIQRAAATGTPLRLRGGGSKDFYGQSLQGELLDTTAFHGVLDYEPSELVVTVRCGTPLAELEALLATHGQMLAFEPPQFAAASTVGGMVASGLSGPRRASAGAVRDFVLGVGMMNGRGEVLHFGGQVMKNVAGYDVSRLLTGSLGTLGLILQVSLKVLPLPRGEASLRFEMSEIDALAKLNAWAGQPLPISASAWQGGVLTLRLSGAEAAVRAARRTLGGALVSDDGAFWRSLRDHRHAWFDDAPLWRLSLPSTASALILGGEQLIEWGGAQRWLKAAPGQADAIRRSVAAAGGHATLFRQCERDGTPVFHPLAPALARIHQRLKAEFDPAAIFNPGRMD
jgi:glycolate oxidase FAD binding subunit